MARDTARMALLTAVGLLLAWIEHLLMPSMVVPGVKLGLANLATLLTLEILSVRAALGVSVARVMLSSFLFGSPITLLYALAGAMVSLVGMIFLRRTQRFSVVGVSAAGGFLHNMAQLGMAALMVGGSGLGVYLPILMVAGTLTGCINGVLAKILLTNISKKDVKM